MEQFRLIPEATYQSHTLALRPGDTLILFTDGVIEAMDPDAREFGITRLREVLQGNEAASIEELQSVILRAVEEFTCGARQADDVTLLLVRYLGAAQAVEAAAAGR